MPAQPDRIPPARSLPTKGSSAVVKDISIRDPFLAIEDIGGTDSFDHIDITAALGNMF